jgi:hypothetical protein
MEEHLVLTLNDDLDVVNLESRKTSGLAHQLALRITDKGLRARVVDPDDALDVRYLYDQMTEKRTMGFIKEYGNVPNGTRTPGDGCRSVGNMIYPAFGGRVELPKIIELPTETSNTELEIVSPKILTFPDKQYKIKIGGKLIS